ncbi:hypothetical protein FZI91_13225 [Mycobacterium sp. CBMA271]|uniref:hypothetical protein n=1 Tax=unclassified Mycobacteroides TaxID=2618759 RepID=UPI0012DC3141|nr:MULTISPECIES: hypothetical protein [unclassified Mycobacteroides]MUM22656.1 hypothetical protein [Mycobacteroides sp. CBMA 271]
MALSGDCAARGVDLAAAVLLRALLIIAVVLAPVLTCAPAPAAAAGVTAAGQDIEAAPARVAEVPYVLATAASTGDHHECPLLPVVTAVNAAATSTLHGWVTAPSVVALAVLAAWATWRLGTRGPPRGQPHWLLSNGRDHLLHFCVMRR